MRYRRPMPMFAIARSSRLAATLLWLLLALMPLRSLAQGWMLVADAAVASATAAPMALDEPAPCHGHAGSGGAHEASATADHPLHAGCGLCDLCHAAGLPAAAAVPHFGPVPDPAVRAAADQPATPPAPDGPFRPPRG
jgi:hypothetical protein